jgi:hypothetical protein
VLLAAVVLILAGCSAKLPDVQAQHSPRPITPVTAGPSLAPDEQQTVDAAWSAYLTMNRIYVKAAQNGNYDFDPDPAKRALYPYAGGRLVAGLERDLGILVEQGWVRTGEPKITLRRVVSVSPTSIVVEACVDDTGTDTVLKTTKKSVAVKGQNQRYPVTLRAGLYPDSRWRWVDSSADRGSSC